MAISENAVNIEELRRQAAETWNITVSGNLKAIPEGAFSDVSNLKKVVILPGVEEIGNAAFKDCSALVSVYMH